MTENAITTAQQATLMENVIIGGDLSKLTPAQRVSYYLETCKSLGINPLTKPFDYIQLNGRLVLYARKDCTDQLRDKKKVSIVKLEREKIEDIYTVTAYAQMPDGRQDSSIGAVSIGMLKGDALANAIMKAETKAKRRVTLSICGLGIMDETEVETTPAIPVTVNEQGEITNLAQNAPKSLQETPGATQTQSNTANGISTPAETVIDPKTDSKGKAFAEMDVPELAGHFNEYRKRIKANPNDEESIKKAAECEYWINQKKAK